MTNTLIYLVGEPGAGKSTLLRHALQGWNRTPQRKPLAHDLLHRNGLVEALELGVRRPQFPGTDALAMNAIVNAEKLLARPAAPIVIGEGARLGIKRFFQYALDAGYELRLAYIYSPNAAAQRMARDGGAQKDSWVRAQATKASNVVGEVRKMQGDVSMTRINTQDLALATYELRAFMALPDHAMQRAKAAA